MRSQTEKAEAFVALHARPGAFVIPNPWDAGTAKLLAAMGFEALATTSLGFANTLGTADVSLEAIIENCRIIADATDLPVSADLEKIAVRTSRRRLRARSGLPPRPARSAGRSRIRRVIRKRRSTISRLPSSACRPRSRLRARCRFRSR
jgi:hypothetical protein